VIIYTLFDVPGVNAFTLLVDVKYY